MPDAEPSSRPFYALMRAAFESTAGARGRFFLFVFFFICAYLIALRIPWAQGYAIQAFVTHGVGEVGFQEAAYWIAMLVVLRLAYAILHHTARYIQESVAYIARMHTLQRIFSAFFSFPLHWHTNHHSGDKLTKLNRSAGAIHTVVATHTWLILESLIKTVVASGALFFLDLWVALNVVGMGIISVLCMVFFNRRLTGKYRQNNSFWNKINRICIDYLFNIVTVKTLSLEGRAETYLDNQRSEGLTYCRKIAKYNELKWGVVTVGYALMIGSSLLIYFYKVHAAGAEFQVAEVYVIIAYLEMIWQAIGSFTGYYSGVVQDSTAYVDGAEILRESDQLPKNALKTEIDEKWTRLFLNQINFSYVAGDGVGLHDMSLEIAHGDKVALVGPSGGGKSTLLKVIGGLLLAESGTAATDLQSGLTLHDIARISLLVPQEPEIFSESFEYNMTMGEDFPSDEIRRFLRLGGLERVLEKLPHGMETNLAEKGLNLSVGEKQRVAMVRGLLRVSRRQILLLDEPTSSLDPKTEKEIFLSLLEHFKDRVIITACHRLNIVPLFDKIVFVRNGRIVEAGTFSELIRSRGAFAEAWDDYERRIPK